MKAENEAALHAAVQRLLEGGVAGRVEVSLEALEVKPAKDEQPDRDPALRPPPDAA